MHQRGLSKVLFLATIVLIASSRAAAAINQGVGRSRTADPTRSRARTRP